MCCPWFKSFCCCLPLRWGAILIALLEMFYCGLEIVVLQFFYDEEDYDYLEDRRNLAVEIKPSVSRDFFSSHND